MKTVALGNLTVSAQGLGCMGMSSVYGAADWDESFATIRRALDLGVTHIDTASGYGLGHYEVLVGRAVAGRRDEVQLATKVGMDFTTGRGKVVIRNDAEYIKAACDHSLLRLGTDRIDLYYLHRVNPQVPLEESIGALADLVAEGKAAWPTRSPAPATELADQGSARPGPRRNQCHTRNCSRPRRNSPTRRSC
ncbi:aldo/keto reductase [Streptomyces sp. NPDC001536]|uniref:aldo/keto reductase n=1 Tax=Streptomyces sp. NPDC001536 TaxID=3364583 RepID=UPI00369F7004